MGSADANASTNAASSSREGDGDWRRPRPPAVPASPECSKRGKRPGLERIHHRRAAPRGSRRGRASRPASTGASTTPSGLSVEPITDFVQTSPVEGAPATERTQVWIAYDPRPPLPRLLRALLGPRHHPGEPGGARPVDGRRPDGGPVRPVPRPAARLPVLGERVRRAGRLDRQRRRERVAQPQPASGGRAADRAAEGGGGGGGGGGRRGRRQLPGRVRHPGRPFLGRAVRGRRGPRRGRLDGRDGHPLQEPPLPGAGRRPAAPLGPPDQPQHPREVRVARLVARLARHRRPAHPDGDPGGADGPVDEPQPGVPAHVHRPAGSDRSTPAAAASATRTRWARSAWASSTGSPPT